MSALDNAVQKVRQVASTATKKTGVAMELSKLRLKVHQVNSMMQSTYERIGTLVYEQEKTGTDNSDLIAVCIKEIDALLLELNELNIRISELKNGVSCPVCGVVNQANSIYCQSCGANVEKRRSERKYEAADNG